MAIVHVAMKSSASAPPSAAHADYIARAGKYEQRGDVVHVEPGNMPEFAHGDQRAFWQAADTHERANGRAYTELQIALPRELNDEQRIELAQEAAREFMGGRFAYILAVHNPVAKDKIEQPHLHIMFSERVVDERTRTLPEDQFFKRNGAKKDREWNDRTKPEEIRVKWCEMMNRAMEREGIEERVDPRSWADQGREDLAALREEKELRGDKPDAVERRKEIAQLRELRKELSAPGLAQVADLQELESEAAAQIAMIERKLEKETGILDKLITKAREALGQVVEWGQNLLASPRVPVFARMSRTVPPDLAQSGPPPPTHIPVTPSVADAAKAQPDRGADRLRDFLAGVDDFQLKADADIAQKQEAERRAAMAKLTHPDRKELDRQLREIARTKARHPDGRIQAVEEIMQSEITGRVLGYTSGREEALFQRLGGELVRLNMRGKPPFEIGKEIDYNPRSRDISRGHGMER